MAAAVRGLPPAAGAACAAAAAAAAPLPFLPLGAAAGAAGATGAGAGAAAAPGAAAGPAPEPMPIHPSQPEAPPEPASLSPASWPEPPGCVGSVARMLAYSAADTRVAVRGVMWAVALGCGDAAAGVVPLDRDLSCRAVLLMLLSVLLTAPEMAELPTDASLVAALAAAVDAVCRLEELAAVSRAGGGGGGGGRCCCALRRGLLVCCCHPASSSLPDASRPGESRSDAKSDGWLPSPDLRLAAAGSEATGAAQPP
mmetsp:Transcript_19256/g.49002  ORF Transcript_19256/g.49002 Transcript_19256/m.49002 type:complete len:255 (+) Transcript_19256:1331-2095(+)